MNQLHEHTLDLWNPIVQMRFLGDPLAEFVAVAEADGWSVELWGDVGSKGPRIHTLQARYDYVDVCSKNGRVVAIGQSAWGK